jgi:peptidyl-prolyl cis-trans isomerase C
MTIKTIAGALLLGTALSFAAAPAWAEDAAAPAAPATDAAAAPAAPAEPSPDAVVATVGDQTITESDLAFAAEDLQKELQQVPEQERRAFLVTVLIDMKVMAKAARDAGMDQTDLFKRRVAYLEDRTLRRSYFADKIAAGVTEETLKAGYDRYVAAFVPEEQVRARHILVATEDEAKAVKADLDGGKPFEVEAMDKTIDPSGKQSGGDLGFFGKGQMVPEFEAAAWALQPGQISEPVKSEFGWHIIKLEEKTLSQPQPIEQLAQQLGQQAMFEAYDVAIAGFKAAMPVSIPDAALAEQVKRQSEPQGGQ